MTTHNTAFDAANTAVRAFLTSLGQRFLGHGFNTSSGRGKRIWLTIKSEDFVGRCAYCNVETDAPTIEHLIQFNRSEGGLHHPGNVVPCCRSCQRRRRSDDGAVGWETHLQDIVERDGDDISEYRRRRDRILEHVARYDYPKLSEDEVAAIRTIAQAIYDGVAREVARGEELFWAIDEALIHKKR